MDMDQDLTTNLNPKDPNERAKKAPEPIAVRTYATDMSEEIKKQGSTLASIAVAERAKNYKDEEAAQAAIPAAEPRSYRTVIILVATLVLLMLGAGLGGYAYLNREAPSVAAVKQVDSIILPNKAFDVVQVPERPLVSTLGTERTDSVLPLSEIARFDVYLTGSSTDARAILRELGAPEELRRETQRLMLGVHAFNRSQPYIIIEVAQYDRAYAAMLDWEDDIGRSLGGFFRPLNGVVPPTTVFTDQIYRNIDTRISQNEWPILYAFPRKNILVITTNNQTLQEIMTRLTTVGRGTVR